MDATTGIRIEVSQVLYEKLQDEQEKRRVTTGKKPALSAIILEFCSEKLSMSNNVQTSLHLIDENVQKTVQSREKYTDAEYEADNKFRQWDAGRPFRDHVRAERGRNPWGMLEEN